MSVQDDILRQTAERAAAQFEGFKIEVVGGQIVMTPQSDIQSWTIRRVQNAAEASGIAEERLLSDVLIQFPGEPPRVPDVTILEDGAKEPYSYDDVLAAVEIVSTEDDDNDYVIKLKQYARFGIPTYLIIDPFRGQCTLLTRPKGGTYASRDDYAYGETVTLHLTDGSEVAVPTDKFKRKN
ncbi:MULTISPECIES: Uma2 family endonuclease [Streptomyces violaceusniger group]|uniref:Uma2 family endonuclease n=2 Tax=Streptomyces javensis TaxID=114698 RepID=A0ABP4HFM6_9ACTN|nr:Uma2 family endonuclease [Streptomyces javensis]MBI0317122.1 Uma2 family endonuclease [Streptomyces javensis]